ncbi:hypothetical protein BC830DRAFT_1101887 [Chytriomyces sp. MP71]|nr:hypothetical protein BC830DRAFT_1101887 [Chytriomyces sp. MP71]
MGNVQFQSFLLLGGSMSRYERHAQDSDQTGRREITGPTGAGRIFSQALTSAVSSGVGGSGTGIGTGTGSGVRRSSGGVGIGGIERPSTPTGKGIPIAKPGAASSLLHSSSSMNANAHSSKHDPAKYPLGTSFVAPSKTLISSYSSLSSGTGTGSGGARGPASTPIASVPKGRLAASKANGNYPHSSTASAKKRSLVNDGIVILDDEEEVPRSHQHTIITAINNTSNNKKYLKDDIQDNDLDLQDEVVESGDAPRAASKPVKINRDAIKHPLDVGTVGAVGGGETAARMISTPRGPIKKTYASTPSGSTNTSRRPTPVSTPIDVDSDDALLDTTSADLLRAHVPSSSSAKKEAATTTADNDRAKQIRLSALQALNDADDFEDTPAAAAAGGTNARGVSTRIRGKEKEKSRRLSAMRQKVKGMDSKTDLDEDGAEDLDVDADTVISMDVDRDNNAAGDAMHVDIDSENLPTTDVKRVKVKGNDGTSSREEEHDVQFKSSAVVDMHASTNRRTSTRLNASPKPLKPIIPIRRSAVEPWARDLFLQVLDLFDVSVVGHQLLLQKLADAFCQGPYIEIRSINIEYALKASERTDRNQSKQADLVMERRSLNHIELGLCEEIAVLCQQEVCGFQPALPLAVGCVLGLNPGRVMEVLARLQVPMTLPTNQADGSIHDRNTVVDSLRRAQFLIRNMGDAEDPERSSEVLARRVDLGDIFAADYTDVVSSSDWTYFGRLWGSLTVKPEAAGNDPEMSIGIDVRPLDETEVPDPIPERRVSGLYLLRWCWRLYLVLLLLTVYAMQQYIRECIATVRTRKYFAESHPFPEEVHGHPGCECATERGMCGVVDLCACLEASPFGFAYNHDALREVVETHVVECGDLCRCQCDGCENRWTQTCMGTKRPWIFDKVQRGLYVRATRRMGWGLFTDVDIGHGSFVGEYVGVIVPPTGVAIRRTVYEGGNADLFVVREGSRNGIHVESFGIDATYSCNYTRFINHSCTPNLRAVLIYKRDKNPSLPRVALFTRTRVAKGAQLTLNYADPEVGGIEYEGMCECDRCLGDHFMSQVRIGDVIVEDASVIARKGKVGRKRVS